MFRVDFRVVLPAEDPRAEEIGSAVRMLAARLAEELDPDAAEVSIDREADGDAVLIRAVATAEPDEIGEDVPQLTPRQWQILRLLDRGLLSKQIALELGLSHYTVSNHIHAILRKFDAPSRTRALHRARRLHLI
jgi:DNA-binding NarL/FixJ family response regulator